MATQMMRDQIAAWLEATRGIELVVGLDAKEAERRALALLAAILENRISPDSMVLDEEAKQVLSILVRQLAELNADKGDRLRQAAAVARFIGRLRWSDDNFGEKEDLLLECEQVGLGEDGITLGGTPPNTPEFEVHAGKVDPIKSESLQLQIGLAPTFPVIGGGENTNSSRSGRPRRRLLSENQASEAAERTLAIPISERAGKEIELRLEAPETLLAMSGLLRARLDVSPATAREEADYLYRFLDKPKREIGLFDERDYFLGEMALIAATACRHLSLREDSKRWLDRSEAGFRKTINGAAEWARVSYQRLALRMEEREFEEVLSLAPSLFDDLVNRGMGEHAIKCRFLEGGALIEMGRLAEAVKIFESLCEHCALLKNENLLAGAYTNLTHCHALLGESKEALSASKEASRLLRRAGDRIGLAKLQWFLGNLLREQHQLTAAIEIYRSAQSEFSELSMQADVAAIHLIVADLMLELGQDAQARWEIQAALPVIDEKKMVPEGMAALALLRQSLRNHRINREALRNLHGYFEDLGS